MHSLRSYEAFSLLARTELTPTLLMFLINFEIIFFKIISHRSISLTSFTVCSHNTFCTSICFRPLSSPTPHTFRVCGSVPCTHHTARSRGPPSPCKCRNANWHFSSKKKNKTFEKTNWSVCEKKTSIRAIFITQGIKFHQNLMFKKESNK